MIGKLYCYRLYKSKDGPAEDLAEMVNTAVKDFERNYGYVPKFAIVHADEVKKGHKFRIAVRKVARNCAPGHFYLYPFITKRHPRVLEGDRVPCLTLK